MMPITYSKKQASLIDFVTVEDAEGLLDWIQNNPSARINLERCSHLHPSNLQVLMAAGSRVAAWPADAGLRTFLETVLTC